jgi:hypothetical protein
MHLPCIVKPARLAATLTDAVIKALLLSSQFKNNENINATSVDGSDPEQSSTKRQSRADTTSSCN